MAFLIKLGVFIVLPAAIIYVFAKMIINQRNKKRKEDREHLKEFFDDDYYQDRQYDRN
jgi:preprotein translocase subunit YajC